MMRQVALLLLMLVSASSFHKKSKVPLKPYEKFQKFVKAHVIQKSMHKNECFNMMKTKRINQDGKNCKTTNTFIRASIQDVIDVCKNGEKVPVNNEIMSKSLGEFDITVCKVKEEGKFPKCKYEGEKKKAKILIKCTNVSLPVHFHDEADYEDYGLVLWS